jgi:hypothetical protein
VFQAQPQFFLSTTVAPVALSVALKIDAIPLRASTSVSWYWSRRSPTLTSRIRLPVRKNS